MKSKGVNAEKVVSALSSDGYGREACDSRGC